jgi:arylformamidase
MGIAQEFYDLSLAIEVGRSRAWYIPGPSKSPVRLGDWVGSVEEGGAVNFMTWELNPHAHGSHTETLGHVCAGYFPVHQVPIPFVLKALLISVTPTRRESLGACMAWEEVLEAIQRAGGIEGHQALVVRTLPNAPSKREVNYSNGDAPYFDAAVGRELAVLGIDHWVVDLPSVDREEDGGALACHRAFWGLSPNATTPGPEARSHATITELVYVPQGAKDGTWSLSLQVSPLANDAAPSRPVLYR